MLIFTLESGDSLVVGDVVTIRVLAIEGKEVRFGTEAPIDIAVHRKELYQRIYGDRHSRDKSDDIWKCTVTKTVLRLLSSRLRNKG